MNVPNLEKLAAYLESLPADYAHFNMGNFMIGRVADYLQDGQMHCGTAGCAVGHGPAAGIPLSAEQVQKISRKINGWDASDIWQAYSETNFIPSGTPEWEWCFGGGWTNIDDTPHGAAKRIRWLLAGNSPPQIEDEDGVPWPFDTSYVTIEHTEIYA